MKNNFLDVVRRAALKKEAQKKARRVAVQVANKQYGTQQIN